MVHPVKSHITNMLILLAKQHIYRYRCLKEEPDIRVFTKQVRMIYSYETYYAKMNKKISKHNKKWKRLYQHLNTSDIPFENIENESFIDEYVSNNL